MASNARYCVLSCLFITLYLLQCSNGGRVLATLVEEQTPAMVYHKGPVLTGSISINLVFYGKFSASQRAIIADFITSLSLPDGVKSPSVFTWWKTLAKYYAQCKKPFPRVGLGAQVLDASCSLGKSLRTSDLPKLAARGGRRSNAVNVVLTAEDVTVDGFCMSRCGTHGSSTLPAPPKKGKSSKAAGDRFSYIWVGNSAAQCPGQCAWPFAKPIYGPQTTPLRAPNGDVGVDGMVINLASLLAGTVTNPYGNGFYQGERFAPQEAGTACAGVYGKGAYPGYAGELRVDVGTGSSYNANGAEGRKYLLPALFDPSTSSCFTLV